MGYIGPSHHSTTPSFQACPSHWFQKLLWSASLSAPEQSLPSSPGSLALAHSTAATPPPPAPRRTQLRSSLRPLHGCSLHLRRPFLIPTGRYSPSLSRHADGWLPATLLTTTSSESPSVYRMFYSVFPIILVWKRPYSLAHLSSSCSPHEDTVLRSYFPLSGMPWASSLC